MVRDTRVPSSSSSSSVCYVRPSSALFVCPRLPPTNSDRLDPHSFLEVSVARVVCVLGLEDSFAAKGIDEGGSTLVAVRTELQERGVEGRSTCSTCAADHQTELNSFLDILLPANLRLRSAHAVSGEHDTEVCILLGTIFGSR